MDKLDKLKNRMLNVLASSKGEGSLKTRSPHLVLSLLATLGIPTDQNFQSGPSHIGVIFEHLGAFRVKEMGEPENHSLAVGLVEQASNGMGKALDQLGLLSTTYKK